MKCMESWLREWVNPPISREALGAGLTMAGLEVEEMTSIRDSALAPQIAKNKLNDHIIDIAITPNRGDCLSIRGLAREISALTNTPLRKFPISLVKSVSKDTLPIHLQATAACPRYNGRIIRQINIHAPTPDWLKDRLLCSGINTINCIVDVANYVMLELGQPMHAFDLNTIQERVNVRLSVKGEKIALLDGSTKQLDANTLVVADKTHPLAIAGVMGGVESSVTLQTQDILLESAYFSPPIVARQRQHYGLNSDSAYRFERGVDPMMQREAIERATQLILEIAGGNPGPVMEKVSKTHLPKNKKISLNADKIQQILGLSIPNKEINGIFKSLNFPYKYTKNKWVVQSPLYRFDITLPEDLIEEIARLYGYEKIPTLPIYADLQANKELKGATDLSLIRQALCDQGYNEIISYSFIDKKLQELLDPDFIPCELLNPITTDMSVMRTNLWPGLINSLMFNRSRQQQRIRLFEVGTCFVTDKTTLTQVPKIGGLISGLRYPEQWSIPAQEVDFYDLKGSIENLLSLNFPSTSCTFKPDTHPALHPGQTASIYYQDKKIGIMGALHPQILQNLGIIGSVFVFEMALKALEMTIPTRLEEISKFPEIRRDLAILIKQTIPAKDIQDTIKKVAGSWLKEVFIFDVYQGKGIALGLKSIALALILQHPTRTLVDEEVTELINNVMTALKGQLGAELRS
jgi:phenylalanyl-tRNA synthetase beta chain